MKEYQAITLTEHETETKNEKNIMLTIKKEKMIYAK